MTNSAASWPHTRGRALVDEACPSVLGSSTRNHQQIPVGWAGGTELANLHRRLDISFATWLGMYECPRLPVESASAVSQQAQHQLHTDKFLRSTSRPSKVATAGKEHVMTRCTRHTHATSHIFGPATMLWSPSELSLSPADVRGTTMPARRSAGALGLRTARSSAGQSFPPHA